MSKVFIASTITSSVDYCFYKDINGLPFAEKKIRIVGGANLAGDDSSNGALQGLDEQGNPVPIWTPYGVITEISAEDYALLETNDTFKTHVEHGYIKKLEKDPRATKDGVKKIAADMNDKDKSAPTTDATLGATGSKGLKISSGAVEQ